MGAEGFIWSCGLTKGGLEGAFQDQLLDVIAAGEPKELFVEESLEKYTATTVSPSVR